MNYSLSDISILIVDDILQNIQILGKIINEKGYTVEFATNGKEAIDWVNSRQFDMILLDIMMPEMNGYEVCDILKNNELTKEIPVIFMTALSDTESKIKAFELGAVDYITKPFESSEVIARINTHITLNNLQKQLKQSNKTLEQKVEERTRQLVETNRELSDRNTEILKMNDELKIAKDKAEESDRLKSSFLKNMSHEVRTPLNAITGFADLLSVPNLSKEKHKKYTDIISANSQKLINIISDVIEISQIDTKQIVVAEKEIELIQFIYKIIQDIEQKAFEKNLNFSYHIPSQYTEFYIVTDDSKLKKIIYHLLDNALKFTLQGRIEFYLLISENQIEIKIKDTGIGISNEMFPLIFEPFRQVETGIRRNFGGNGLGLTLTKAYIELLNGSISINSKLNEGTLVHITIPVVFPEPSNNVINNNNSHLKICNTILIAEDEYANYLYLVEILENFNIEIIHVTNGQQAIEVCKTNKAIGLVLMDIKMSVLDGFTATSQIKQFRPDLPVFAQSAYALDSEREIYKGIFDEYFTKPIDKKALTEKILKYIKF